MASLEREQIRHEHAKWSDSTFGCVGPIGPLKHLSKEALEAAAEPDDLSEWADMQFLLWDAQRRAGISDAEITAAMENKLKINMERQWPEPKDGEPRLHIKEPGNSPVIPDGWIRCSERMPEMGERQCYVLAADFKNNYPPNIPNTQVGVYGDWFNDGKPTWDDGDGEDLYLKEVTHWMPLPEAPLEVK
ncbi:dATP/dGTP pyrophosphohydrolase domain-containing protein [Escherichia coli]|uniref:dATP/dGTP pyrophosphohydrolase domain-containing protein n=1 Tax=Escherichia coli TaxID=562 RepID=UPI0020233BB0|nr:dATP/dGTP pyrophosphohydrolase domain-containing protein [Escherichia coli]